MFFYTNQHLKDQLDNKEDLFTKADRAFSPAFESQRLYLPEVKPFFRVWKMPTISQHVYALLVCKEIYSCVFDNDEEYEKFLVLNEEANLYFNLAHDSFIFGIEHEQHFKDLAYKTTLENLEFCRGKKIDLVDFISNLPKTNSSQKQRIARQFDEHRNKSFSLESRVKILDEVMEGVVNTGTVKAAWRTNYIIELDNPEKTLLPIPAAFLEKINQS